MYLLGKTEDGETVLPELQEEKEDAHPIPSTFDVSNVSCSYGFGRAQMQIYLNLRNCLH